MKRKTQIKIVAGMILLILVLWSGWYLFFILNKIEMSTVTEIQITMTSEEGITVKRVANAADIKTFMELWNSFALTPRLNKPGFGGGWLIKADIKRNDFPSDLTLMFTGAVVSINGRSYNMNKDAVDQIKELFYQEDFGENTNRVRNEPNT